MDLATAKDDGGVGAVPRDLEGRAVSINVSIAATAALLTFLGIFRFEKAAVIGSAVSGSEWLRVFLADLATAGTVGAASWLLQSVLPQRLHLYARRMTLLVVAAIGVLAVVEHQFFLSTGIGLRWRIALYALENVGGLGGVLSAGIDHRFAVRLSLVALCVLLLSRASAAVPRRRRIGQSAGVAVVLIAACVSLAVSQTPGFNPVPLGVISFLDLAPQRLHAGAPLSLYRQPRITAVDTVRRKNVIVIVLESTRADAAWFDGPAERAAMPFLNNLALRGVRVEPTYAVISHTSKSLAAIFCGMYPRLRHEILEAQPGGLPLNCLPRLLGEMGYDTLFLQTAKGDFENRAQLLRNLGFESWRLQEDLPQSPQYGYFGMDERAMLAPALDFVRQRREQRKPFLLSLLTVSTHHPYATPLDHGVSANDRAAYRGALGYVDGFLRDFVDGLNAQGALDDTVLIIVGDHGEAFQEHKGRRQHDAVPYEEGLRVPLLLVGPQDAVGTPRRIQSISSHLDIVPTIFEALAIRWDGALPGRSLLSPREERSVISSCYFRDYCMSERVGSRKTIYHFDRAPAEVFDVVVDPRESHDLASTLPPAEIDAAAERMLRLRRSVDAFYGDF